MKTCTFFGHRDCPNSIYDTLRYSIIKLIENNNVERFYVGNQGNFDHMAIKIFQEIKPLYPDIIFNVVLAYIPTNKNAISKFILENSLVPEGIETVPKKFAISHRNRWLVNNSHIIISYIIQPFGGAAQYTELARRRKKQIINLAEILKRSS